VEQAEKPVHKKLVENGATSQLHPKKANPLPNFLWPGPQSGQLQPQAPWTMANPGPRTLEGCPYIHW